MGFKYVVLHSLCMFDVASTGIVSWDKNWITYIDGMLHTALIADGLADFRIPVHIQRLQIDPTRLNESQGKML